MCIVFVLIIDRVSTGGNAIAAVRESVTTVTFEPSDLYV